MEIIFDENKDGKSAMSLICALPLIPNENHWWFKAPASYFYFHQRLSL
jgi:hypothetical protein